MRPNNWTDNKGPLTGSISFSVDAGRLLSIAWRGPPTTRFFQIGSSKEAGMLLTTLDAKVKLEEEGLHVSCNDAHSLWIASSMRDAGEGVNISDDACVLIWKSGSWVAVFRSQGSLTYQVPGALTKLVSLISAVYAEYRQAGGPFNNALKQVVNDADQFLIGRAPVQV